MFYFSLNFCQILCILPSIGILRLEEDKLFRRISLFCLKLNVVMSVPCDTRLMLCFDITFVIIPSDLSKNNTTFPFAAVERKYFLQKKLTPGFDFNNILPAVFFLRNVFSESFLHLQFVFVIFGTRTSARKLLKTMLVIDYWDQFHQHFFAALSP